MLNLLNVVQANQEKARKAMWVRYVQLLEQESGSQEDAQELAEIMEALGRSAEQAETDARTLRGVRQMQRRIQEGAGVEERIQKASAAVTESASRLQESIQKLRAEHYQIVIEANRIGDLQRGAIEAREQLEALTKREPELLAAAK